MRTPIQNQEALKRLRALIVRMEDFSKEGFASSKAIDRWVIEMKVIESELDKENQ